MDALDLSVGEKKNRRKTQIPQRRQNLTESSRAIADSTIDDINETMLKNESDSIDRKTLDTGDIRNSGGNLRDTQSIEDPGKMLFHVVDDDINSETSSMSPMLDDSSKQSLKNGRHMRDIAIGGINYHDPPKESIMNTSIVKKYPNANASLKDYCERLNKRSFRPSFTGVKSKDDVQPMDTPGIPERTKKQNRWAFNVWREWARKRNFVSCGSGGEYQEVPLDVGKASESQLDHWLSKFVQEVRRKDGNPYPPHTLMQIVMGIQRYLRQQAGRPSICILDRSNPTYSSFRTVLDSRIKELTNNGVTSSIKNGRKNSSLQLNSKVLSSSSMPHYPEESGLWESGVIGLDTALGLLNAVFFHNTVSFGIRTIDDHWNLKMCHFEVGICGEQTYVEFVPSKDPVYVNRGLTQDRRLYSDPKNSRCAVNIFQKYLSLVPNDGAFYRHPQEPTLVDRSIRFSDQWIGKNRLRAMIKHIFDTTRLDGVQRHHHGQINWPVATPMLNLNSYAAHKPTGEPTLLGNNIYDRLAQAMLQLSRATKPTGAFSHSDSHTGPATPVGPSSVMSSSPRLSDNEESKEQSNSSSLSRARGSAELQLENYDVQSKRLRMEIDRDQQIELSRPSSSGISHDNNVLEISVPKMITSVVITKGGSRVTVDLD